MTHTRNDGQIQLKDEARTPPSLFKRIYNRYRPNIDAACTIDNCICDYGFAREFQDALAISWANPPDFAVVPSIYCNPPYSFPAPWIKKAYEESLHGIVVTMLLPADTSVKVFHKYILPYASDLIFLEPRVIFNNPDGTPMKGSPKFGCMIPVFDIIRRYENGHINIESWNWKRDSG